MQEQPAVVPQIKRQLGVTKHRAQIAHMASSMTACRELVTLRNNVKALKRLLPQARLHPCGSLHA
jgi:hypothetical protein